MKITQPVISTEPKISDLGGQFSTKVKNQTFYFFEGDNFLCNFFLLVTANAGELSTTRYLTEPT